MLEAILLFTLMGTMGLMLGHAIGDAPANYWR